MRKVVLKVIYEKMDEIELNNKKVSLLTKISFSFPKVWAYEKVFMVKLFLTRRDNYRGPSSGC